MNAVYRDGERQNLKGYMLRLTTALPSFNFRSGIRFYLYIFCATLTNVLVTLLAPVRDPQNPALRDTSNHVMRPD